MILMVHIVVHVTAVSILSTSISISVSMSISISIVPGFTTTRSAIRPKASIWKAGNGSGSV